MQTVTIPMPRAVSAATGTVLGSSIKQARLQGLLLVPASKASRRSTGHKPLAAAADDDEQETLVDISSTAVVALLACSDKQPRALLGFFGGSSTSKQGQQGSAADLYLVKGALETGSSLQQRPHVSLPTAAAARTVAEQQQQQQQAGGRQAQVASDGSTAVVAALQAIQLSLEGRLDAMQQTLLQMDQRLQALERRNKHGQTL
jgi:hypothetical protein